MKMDGLKPTATLASALMPGRGISGTNFRTDVHMDMPSFHLSSVSFEERSRQMMQAGELKRLFHMMLPYTPLPSGDGKGMHIDTLS